MCAARERKSPASELAAAAGGGSAAQGHRGLELRHGHVILWHIQGCLRVGTAIHGITKTL